MLIRVKIRQKVVVLLGEYNIMSYLCIVIS
nr:MAG TPA: hypothetical protein [Caudoviricetes sp.]